MRKAAAAIALTMVAAAGTAKLAAGDHVEMHVTPQVAFAPADLSVRATIQTDPSNRAIEVIADSSDFYRSSEIQLDGDRAPHIAVFVFRDVPRGVYDVRAILKGRDGQELAATRTRVTVVTQ
jgi:hypothetical protein